MVRTATAPTFSYRTSSTVGLPATAPLGGAGAALGGELAACLALVQLPLQQAHHEDEQREEGDHDEARLRRDLVVDLAVGPLAAVVRERDGREEQEGDDRGEGEAHLPGSYRTSRRWSPSSETA